MNDQALRPTLELKRHCINTSFTVALLVPRIPLSEMRLGQIGCGRQNPPVQSVELPSRIRMVKGIPSTSLQDWKATTAPLLSQKRRWYNAGGFPYRSASRVTPLDACTRVVGCLGCGGAPNVHRCIQNQ
ncbi:Hypothetical_protein [Hexamita inflata]|uniref:Hypothetical_protein n=1 Tax=Hexamita inflata TaxID=28002 RepID=A0AA86N853_9EUKA|nr:Hypothetical protein HINF_LOCUS2248 [Hexamita inflata]